jgi:hypothetical protein
VTSGMGKWCRFISLQFSLLNTIINSETSSRYNQRQVLKVERVEVHHSGRTSYEPPSNSRSRRTLRYNFLTPKLIKRKEAHIFFFTPNEIGVLPTTWRICSRTRKGNQSETPLGIGQLSWHYRKKW